MGVSNILLTYDTIVAKVRQLCNDQCSGALMLMGTQMARIHLTDGEIVALFIQDKKGHEAVPLLPKIKASRMDFIPGLPCTLTTPLPATSVLLQQLTEHAPSSPPGTPVSKGTLTRKMDADIQGIMVEALAQYIGPMAKLLGQDLLPHYQDAEEALQALAQRLPNAEHANRFVAETRLRFAA